MARCVSNEMRKNTLFYFMIIAKWWSSAEGRGAIFSWDAETSIKSPLMTFKWRFMWKNSCYIVEQILPGSKWNPMDKSVNRRRQNYDKILSTRTLHSSVEQGEEKWTRFVYLHNWRIERRIAPFLFYLYFNLYLCNCRSLLFI